MNSSYIMLRPVSDWQWQLMRQVIDSPACEYLPQHQIVLLLVEHAIAALARLGTTDCLHLAAAILREGDQFVYMATNTLHCEAVVIRAESAARVADVSAVTVAHAPRLSRYWQSLLSWCQSRVDVVLFSLRQLHHPVTGKSTTNFYQYSQSQKKQRRPL